MLSGSFFYVNSAHRTQNIKPMAGCNTVFHTHHSAFETI